MNEKDLNRLIESGFGELSETEERSLRSTLSGEDAREIAQFEELRKLMNELPEPGPCQVSWERVQHRIETAQPPRTAWKWAMPWWATGALATALGAVLFFSLRSGGADRPATELATNTVTEHVVPLPDQAPAMDSQVQPAPPRPMADSGPAEPRPVHGAAVSKASKVVSEPRMTQVRVAKASARRNRPSAEPTVTVTILPGEAESPDFGAPAAKAMDHAMMADPIIHVESDPDTVVVIAREEGEIGAPVATEVSTTHELGLQG